MKIVLLPLFILATDRQYMLYCMSKWEIFRYTKQHAQARFQFFFNYILILFFIIFLFFSFFLLFFLFFILFLFFSFFFIIFSFFYYFFHFFILFFCYFFAFYYFLKLFLPDQFSFGNGRRTSFFKHFIKCSRIFFVSKWASIGDRPSNISAA